MIPDWVVSFFFLNNIGNFVNSAKWHYHLKDEVYEDIKAKLYHLDLKLACQTKNFLYEKYFDWAYHPIWEE